MVIVLLVLVVLVYVIILLGLTVWFDKYHYYKNTYFNHISKTDQIDLGLGSSIESQTIVNPEENHRHHVKRGVRRSKTTKGYLKKL